MFDVEDREQLCGFWFRCGKTERLIRVERHREWRDRRWSL